MEPNIKFIIEFLFGGGIIITLAQLIYNTGKIVNKVEHIERRIENDIEPNLKDVRDKVLILWGRQKTARKATVKVKK